MNQRKAFHNHQLRSILVAWLAIGVLWSVK